MHTFGAFIVSLVLGSGLVTALPAAPSTKDTSFSLTAKHNGKFKHNGPAALAKAYRKYGKNVPEDVANAVHRLHHAKRTTGSDTTVPQQYDSEYLTAVQIGTPAQTLNLDFDTGSSDLWVFSTQLPKSQVNGQTLYNPAKSSTSKALSGYTWSITYGDESSSSGNVYTDTVTVGGLTVKSQAVEAAKTVSDQFVQDTPSSGLLGLAFSTINTVKPTKQKTFFDNAKSTLDSPLFTSDLKHGQGKHYKMAQVILGC
jgi:aspergillopepsin I